MTSPHRAELVTPSRPAQTMRGDMPVADLLHGGGPTMVLQPQLSLSRLEVAGYEALARFPQVATGGTGGDCDEHRPPSRDTTPEDWFSQAHLVGLGPELEASAVANALRAGEDRPSGTLLAVNLSPSVLGTAPLHQVLPADLTGIELELTEHEVVLDPTGLRRELDLLRARGARLAVDDVGAGHSGLRRIMELAPDSLKLDRHLVAGVADNTAKAALIRAVVEFADHIGATVCAEGVDTVADLLTLADLDVAYAQGWAIGRPGLGLQEVDPLVLSACRRSLHRALTARPKDHRNDDLPTESAATLEDLLSQFADVSALDDLAQLTHSSTKVLGCERIELSYLRDGGTAVEAIRRLAWQGDGDVYRLADYPATYECLEHRVVIPVYVGAGADPEEEQLLTTAKLTSALLVPVSSRGRAVGLLECFMADERRWSRRQIRAARLVASVLGPVLDGLLSRA